MSTCTRYFEIVWLLIRVLFANVIDSEIYCHPMYAQYSPHPFSVNMDAPRYPFVIPTLIYRNLIKAWWLPLYSFLSWIWTAIFGFDEMSTHTVLDGVRRAASSTTVKSAWRVSSQTVQATEDFDWDLSMGDDQLVESRGRV